MESVKSFTVMSLCRRIHAETLAKSWSLMSIVGRDEPADCGGLVAGAGELFSLTLTAGFYFIFLAIFFSFFSGVGGAGEGSSFVKFYLHFCGVRSKAH